MPELREMLLAGLLDVAPHLGDCPDCYGRGLTHAYVRFKIDKGGRSKLHPRGRFGLTLRPTLCHRCMGSGWLRNRWDRPRPCNFCGRIFQPLLGAVGTYATRCTLCQPGWRLAVRTYRAAHAVGSVGVSPTEPGSYGRAEAQPGVTGGGVSRRPVGAKAGPPKPEAHDAKLNHQVGAPEPGGQGGHGQPAARPPHGAPAQEGPAGSRPAWSEPQRLHAEHLGQLGGDGSGFIHPHGHGYKGGARTIR